MEPLLMVTAGSTTSLYAANPKSFTTPPAPNSEAEPWPMRWTEFLTERMERSLCRGMLVPKLNPTSTCLHDCYGKNEGCRGGGRLEGKGIYLNYIQTTPFSLIYAPC